MLPPATGSTDCAPPAPACSQPSLYSTPATAVALWAGLRGGPGELERGGPRELERGGSWELERELGEEDNFVMVEK